MEKKNVKIIYYVDINTDIKESLCAIPSEIDMRGSEVVNAVAETIGEVFSHNDFIVEHKTDIAKTIAHHEFANIFEYEFGVEETTLFTLK